MRAYLLEKWNRQCVYCGAKNIPLQVEHIHPKSKGGTNRISNLCIACEPCNLAKGTQDIKDFLSGRLTVVFAPWQATRQNSDSVRLLGLVIVLFVRNAG